MTWAASPESEWRRINHRELRLASGKLRRETIKPRSNYTVPTFYSTKNSTINIQNKPWPCKQWRDRHAIIIIITEPSSSVIQNTASIHPIANKWLCSRTDFAFGLHFSFNKKTTTACRREELQVSAEDIGAIIIIIYHHYSHVPVIKSKCTLARYSRRGLGQRYHLIFFWTSFI